MATQVAPAPAETRTVRPIPPGARPGRNAAEAAGSESGPTVGDSTAGIPDDPTEVPGLLNRHGDDLFPDVRKLTAEGREALRKDPAPVSEPDSVEATAPERDAQGRFLPKGGAEVDGEEGSPTPVAATAPEAPAPTPTKLRLAGRDFNTQDEADRFASQTQEERDYGYRAAHAWKAEHDRLKAELDSLRNGGANGQPQAAPAKPTPPIDPLADLDTEGFERMAVEQGLPQAGKYLAAQTIQAVLKHIVPQLRQEISQEFAPVRADHEARAAIEHADNLIAEVAGHTLPDGNPAFPELHGDAANLNLERIGRQWSQAGHSPQSLMTTKGLMTAIALDRMIQGYAPRAVERSLQAAGASVAQARAAVAQSAPAAAAFVEGSDAPTLPPNGGRSTGWQSQMERSLGRPPDVDPQLGFPRYKAPRYTS